jgi:hypothetical protein
MTQPEPPVQPFTQLVGFVATAELEVIPAADPADTTEAPE